MKHSMTKVAAVLLIAALSLAALTFVYSDSESDVSSAADYFPTSPSDLSDIRYLTTVDQELGGYKLRGWYTDYSDEHIMSNSVFGTYQGLPYVMFKEEPGSTADDYTYLMISVPNGDEHLGLKVENLGSDYTVIRLGDSITHCYGKATYQGASDPLPVFFKGFSVTSQVYTLDNTLSDSTISVTPSYTITLDDILITSGGSGSATPTVFSVTDDGSCTFAVTDQSINGYSFYPEGTSTMQATLYPTANHWLELSVDAGTTIWKDRGEGGVESSITGITDLFFIRDGTTYTWDADVSFSSSGSFTFTSGNDSTQSSIYSGGLESGTTLRMRYHATTGKMEAVSGDIKVEGEVDLGALTLANNSTFMISVSNGVAAVHDEMGSDSFSGAFTVMSSTGPATYGPQLGGNADRFGYVVDSNTKKVTVTCPVYTTSITQNIETNYNDGQGSTTLVYGYASIPGKQYVLEHILDTPKISLVSGELRTSSTLYVGDMVIEPQSSEFDIHASAANGKLAISEGTFVARASDYAAHYSFLDSQGDEVMTLSDNPFSFEADWNSGDPTVRIICTDSQIECGLSVSYSDGIQDVYEFHVYEGDGFSALHYVDMVQFTIQSGTAYTNAPIIVGEMTVQAGDRYSGVSVSNGKLMIVTESAIMVTFTNCELYYGLAEGGPVYFEADWNSGNPTIRMTCDGNVNNSAIMIEGTCGGISMQGKIYVDNGKTYSILHTLLEDKYTLLSGTVTLDVPITVGGMKVYNPGDGSSGELGEYRATVGNNGKIVLSDCDALNAEAFGRTIKYQRSSTGIDRAYSFEADWNAGNPQMRIICANPTFSEEGITVEFVSAQTSETLWYHFEHDSSNFTVLHEISADRFSLESGSIYLPVAEIGSPELPVYLDGIAVKAFKGDAADTQHLLLDYNGDLEFFNYYEPYGDETYVIIVPPGASPIEIRYQDGGPFTHNIRSMADPMKNFNSARANYVSQLDEYHASGEAQVVSTLIEQGKSEIGKMVYNQSLSASQNTERLQSAFLNYQEQIIRAQRANSPEHLYEVYLETATQEVEGQKAGSTSKTEDALIDYALSLIDEVNNSQNYSLEEKKAQIAQIRRALEEYLALYHENPGSAFASKKGLASAYISTQSDYGMQEIIDLKTQFGNTLENLQFLNNLTSDKNIERIDEITNAFDAEVLKVLKSKFAAEKSKVFAEIKELSAKYGHTYAGTLIASAESRVSSATYDNTKTFNDNVNRINNILTNLKFNLESALTGGPETYNSYCADMKVKLETLRGQYENSGSFTDEQKVHILSLIDAAIAKVDSQSPTFIAFDNTKSLNDNLNILYSISSDLQEDIKDYLNEQNEIGVNRVYNAAIDHISINDKEGVPTKLREYIRETRILLNAEKAAFDQDPSYATTAGININNIMATYNVEMKALIEVAEFYLNIDQGEKFLREHYGTSYDDVVLQMETYISELKTLEYNQSLSMEDNLALIQDKVNGYSVSLAEMRMSSVRGDFENYRFYVSWLIDSYSDGALNDSERAFIRGYKESVDAVQYTGGSADYDKQRVDKIYGEFMENFFPYQKERAKAVLAIDGDQSVQNAVNEGKAAIDAIVYDRRLSDEDNLARLSLVTEDWQLHISYVLAATGDPSALAFFTSRMNAMSGTAYETIVQGIIDDAGKSDAEKAAAIEPIDIEFRYGMLKDTAVLDVQKKHISEESTKAMDLIDRYADYISTLVYDDAQSFDYNRLVITSVYAEFLIKLHDQRLIDNTLVIGDIRADGTAVGGGEADYGDEDEGEIWGSVGNADGMGNVSSITIERTTFDPGLGSSRTMNAEGSFGVYTGGRLLGAFDITLYDDNDTVVTKFGGEYVVRILLPKDMRGYKDMQVAYKDDFGDIQIYDAKVEGNYLVFTTTHFSTFSVIGVTKVYNHYDLYLAVIVAAIALVAAAYYMRSIRYCANGGSGRMPGQFFFGEPEGNIIENKFSREGYRFAGWSTAPNGTPVSADGAEISCLGKFRFIRLYAVWEQEGIER